MPGVEYKINKKEKKYHIKCNEWFTTIRNIFFIDQDYKTKCVQPMSKILALYKFEHSILDGNTGTGILNVGIRDLPKKILLQKKRENSAKIINDEKNAIKDIADDLEEIKINAKKENVYITVTEFVENYKIFNDLDIKIRGKLIINGKPIPEIVKLLESDIKTKSDFEKLIVKVNSTKLFFEDAVRYCEPILDNDKTFNPNYPVHIEQMRDFLNFLNKLHSKVIFNYSITNAEPQEMVEFESWFNEIEQIFLDAVNSETGNLNTAEIFETNAVHPMAKLRGLAEFYKRFMVKNNIIVRIDSKSLEKKIIQDIEKKITKEFSAPIYNLVTAALDRIRNSSKKDLAYTKVSQFIENYNKFKILDKKINDMLMTKSGLPNQKMKVILKEEILKFNTLIMKVNMTKNFFKDSIEYVTPLRENFSPNYITVIKRMQDLLNFLKGLTKL
ncbi:MAG: hypothetical protein RsTaC01_0123 [Candidatus Paraimprobicoccus trichonymphae]|uniref:Uncharacterized protein n=1 Tax=Candidatus Paraimprobicoccus trichonymphae TaxID=3033793 RepID=A0AA48KZ04_9FIRM|nr:MAG: hypothetical protein RsTaC01_0123 [Candidatus Paraimprobicoccus trichonymphae]